MRNRIFWRRAAFGMGMLTSGVTLFADPLYAQSADPDVRAREAEARMTDDERFRMLHFIMPVFTGPRPNEVPNSIPATAGWMPGIPNIGLPDILLSDASLGVVNPLGLRNDDVATALPSGLALAASFDPDLATRAGAMIGAESRAKGFNILLAGGVNLTREWFGGRNFEYLGEDPLLAGKLAGAVISGVQSKGVASTVKHFALNAQETMRRTVDARIDEGALRESDLLAFQIAIERGKPASVMCSYNGVNGATACSNPWLLNTVLKRDWGYPGWVMSDWGSTHGVEDFGNGLDQQAGENIDLKVWFDAPLKAELAAGRITRERLSESVRRILRSLYAVGADKISEPAAIDYDGNGKVAREAAARGIVLLKNDGILPLDGSAKKVLVVGGFADRGVLSGGGSSNVVPVGGAAAVIPMGGPGFLATFGRMVIHPSAPLTALKAAFPNTVFEFDNGYFPEGAAARAARADLVIIFANQWQTESLDSTGLSLPQGQDILVEKIAKANSNTLVVLQTGNPVDMPWLGSARAVVQAWYSGQRGGEAITDVLTGKVNPSGRLPMTFPQSREQAPRASVPGLGLTDRTPITVEYNEGSDVGYRWYAKTGSRPLFPFGFGLSYSTFEHGSLKITSGKQPQASITVRNTGKRAGADVPQIYLVGRNGQSLQRLAGFARVELQPGESRTIAIPLEPRILADWKGGWVIEGGNYDFAVGYSAAQLGEKVTIRLPRRSWKD